MAFIYSQNVLLQFSDTIIRKVMGKNNPSATEKHGDDVADSIGHVMGKRDDLEKIWEEVIKCIIEKMNEICNTQTPEEYHFNLRAEMIFEFARLQLWLRERIINGRDIDSISVEQERSECFSEKGIEKINNTASMAAEHIWMRRYHERWLPKTRKALHDENNPRPLKKLPIQDNKQINHYIPKFFLKKYWAYKNKLVINKFDGMGCLSKRLCGIGQWGYKKRIYTQNMEAYFSLIEKDAETPLRLIQNTMPLSAAHQEALVGFIVIQKLRNPYFMETLAVALRPLIAHVENEDKANDQEYMKLIYNTMYKNNDFYAKIATPIFENKWVIVNTEEPLFILPDTFNIIGQSASSSFTFVPLTPHRCFVVLPFKYDGELNGDVRIFVPQIQATIALARDICLLQLSYVHSEFVSHPDFSAPQGIAKAGEIVLVIQSELRRC